MMRTLLQGPVGVSVAAHTWPGYRSGIFDGCQPDTVIDHAVVLVAYGEAPVAKYWRLQNSWGYNWGEHGFIRLLRHDPKATDATEEHYCGVDHQPELGNGCKGGPRQVRICGMCGILYDGTTPHFSVPSRGHSSDG